MYLLYIVQLLSLATGTRTQQQPCFPLGPIFPAVRRPAASKSLRQAFSALNATLSASLGPNGSDYGSLDNQSTTFIVDVFSVHSTESLSTHVFNAPDFSNASVGASEVDADTVFRIGSMSKMLSVWNFLIAAGDSSWNDPVTKYVPELAAYASEHAEDLKNGDIRYYDFESITIGALASQTSGLNRDFAFGRDSDASFAGLLPPVVSVDASYCGSTETDQAPLFPCDRANYLKSVLAQYPVVPSWHTPIYSNVAYSILALALENITGEAFNATFESKIIKPLNLKSTHTSPLSNLSHAFIPYNLSFSGFLWDTFDEAPAAGSYSSISDLRSIGSAILNSTLLPQALTRRWFQPTSFSGSPNVSVGAPWEILRAPLAGGRMSWMYTKGGHYGQYTSEMVLLPDWGIGYNVLASGVEVSLAVDTVSNIVAEVVVAAALDAAAAEEAHATYAGTYRSTDTDGGSITVKVDKGPGLLVGNWTWNGTDGLALYATLAAGDPEANISLRLWPTTLTSPDGVGTANLRRAGFRAYVQRLPATLNPYPFLGNCISWLTTDQITYGGVGSDEFVFEIEEGKATGVDARFLRAQYTR